MDELAIPFVRQSTGWSCGPASLAAVMRYYGHTRIGERTMIRRSGCTPEGATVRGLCDAAISYGVTPWGWQGVSYETFTRISELGNPMIAAIQAWHVGGEPEGGYGDIWLDGHFVVVTHADAAGVTCMDPSLPRARGYLAREEWLERWHDVDVGDKRLVQFLIVFPAAVVRRRAVRRTRPVL